MAERKPIVPGDTAETELAQPLVEQLPTRTASVAERHKLIAERASRVHAGAPTLSLDDVERDLRAELDF
jgi:hypothetical protein